MAKEAERRAGIPPAKASSSASRNFKSFSQIPKEKIVNPTSGSDEAVGGRRSLSSRKKTTPSLTSNATNAKLKEYLEDAVRPSSKKTYSSYWRRFMDFCQKKSMSVLEAESVALFLIHLAETTENRVSSLVAKHAIKYHIKLNYPCKKAATDSYLVSRITKSISSKWGKPVKKAKRITSDMVSKMILNLLKTGSFKDERTAMFILIQFICMARYEEVAKLEKAFIEIVPPGHLKVYFSSAKNYNVWDAQTCWAAGNEGGLIDPVLLIQNYLKKLSTEVKFLFPSFRVGKNQVPVFLNKPVSYDNMLSLLKSALSDIGEKGEEFSLHGVRTGSLSEAANSNKNVQRTDIKRHGRWKSQSMVDHYHELSIEKKLAPSRALKIYDQ